MKYWKFFWVLQYWKYCISSCIFMLMLKLCISKWAYSLCQLKMLSQFWFITKFTLKYFISKVLWKNFHFYIFNSTSKVIALQLNKVANLTSFFIFLQFFSKFISGWQNMTQIMQNRWFNMFYNYLQNIFHPKDLLQTILNSECIHIYIFIYFKNSKNLLSV